MELDVDYISLDEEQKEDLERLSALGYSLRDMAMYFAFDYKQFKHDATTEGCVIKYHIDRGRLTVKANAQMKLMQSAEGGNITAIQFLAKVQRDRDYKDLLNQMEENESDD